MPWTSSDAHGKTHKAKSPHAKRVWSKIANANLGKGEGSAIRIANAAIARMKRK